MRIIEELVQGSPEWLEARRGKITGSKLSDIVVKRGTGKKIGYYQLIADKLGIPADDENSMSRGSRLENEAVEMFEKETSKEVEFVGLCISDNNNDIALSPDGLIKDKSGKYTEAVEVKCLGSARHIQAVIENKIPDDYIFQAYQYFIVIEDLKVLNFCFYDPRLLAKPFHIIKVLRENIEKEIETYEKYQMDILAEVEEAIFNL